MDRFAGHKSAVRVDLVAGWGKYQPSEDCWTEEEILLRIARAVEREGGGAVITLWTGDKNEIF